MRSHLVSRLVAALLTAATLAAQRSIPDTPATTDRKVLQESLGGARLQLAEAIHKALERTPGLALRATFVRARVDDQLVPRFEVEILTEGQFFEVHVDAQSGEVTRAEAQAAPRAERSGEMVFDFEKEPLPAGFDPGAGSGATPAAWRTEHHEDAPDGKRILVVETGNQGTAYNLLLRRGRLGPDLTLSTRLQAWKGKEDQGGGLVWRARDSKNYYVARWNPLERNLRLYTVTDGKRSLPIQSVEIEADPAAWHELAVTMTGNRIVIRFDGKTVIEAEDATYPEAGAVGLWTKADASTRFDSFRVMPRR